MQTQSASADIFGLFNLICHHRLIATSISFQDWIGLCRRLRRTVVGLATWHLYWVSVCELGFRIVLYYMLELWVFTRKKNAYVNFSSLVIHDVGAMNNERSTVVTRSTLCCRRCYPFRKQEQDNRVINRHLTTGPGHKRQKQILQSGALLKNSNARMVERVDGAQSAQHALFGKFVSAARCKKMRPCPCMYVLPCRFNFDNTNKKSVSAK